ncbi:hypothetical protein [Caldifermentibacillus hisashii]
MATRSFLVAVLGRKMLNFGGETQSRHHFWGKKLTFLTTKPNLVTVFG